MTENTLAQRLKKARNEAKLSQAQLAARVGLTQGVITQIETGRAQGSTEIAGIAAALGVSAIWLAEGRGHMRAITAVVKAHLPLPGIAASDVVDVPYLDIRASMGNGAHQSDDDNMIQRITLPGRWIREHLPAITSPLNLRIITGLGDSMTPTYNDGDPLIVDTGVHSIDLDAVYVVEIGGELYIKRVQRRPLDKALVIRSDNKLYEDWVIDNGERKQVRIMGRVLWAWNGRKL